MQEWLVIDKSHTVYLKEKGEVCNRLKRGTRVQCLKRNGDWIKITWRNGKKKGWILKPESGRNRS